MIDFRYHLVSLVAVFLALAVGIVLGTTTLKPIVLDDLRSNVHTLTGTTQKQRAELAQQSDQLSHYAAFAKAVEQPLIQGKLAGERVVVIEAPQASDALRSSLTDALSTAGAKVSAQVKLTSDFLDPTQGPRISTLVDSLAPAGVTLPDGTPQQRASALLAEVLTTRPSDHTHPADASAVIQGLADAKLLKVGGRDVGPGDLVLFLVADPASSPDRQPSKDATNTMLDLIGAVDVAGQGTVVAGSIAAADSSMLSAVRSSGISDTVSTVDGVDDPRGVVAVVHALVAQLHGDAGSYGVASSDRPLPSLTP